MLNLHDDSSQNKQTTSARSSESGVKWQRQQLTPEDVGDAKKVKSVNDSTDIRGKVVKSIAVEKLEHLDKRLTEEIAQNIKSEIGWHALRGDNVRITSCHLESGARI